MCGILPNSTAAERKYGGAIASGAMESGKNTAVKAPVKRLTANCKKRLHMRLW
jgi:hypothetical protein